MPVESPPQIMSWPKRPEVNDLKSTTLGIACEIIAFLILLATWAVALYNYGGKQHLDVLVFPSVSTLVYFLLLGPALVSPKLYNYPVEVTANNARALYTLSRQMISLMKVFVMAIFAVLYWPDEWGPEGRQAWVLASLIIVGAGCGVFVYRAMSRVGKEGIEREGEEGEGVNRG